MRRRSEGVMGTGELVEEAIARIEREDPALVIRAIEPHVLEPRRDRLRTTIANRLASVTVVFEAPHDPHNGAAVIRSCEAFGVQALHVIETREPFLAASSVSRGSHKWVDVVRHPSAARAFAELREGDPPFALVAAHPDGDLLPRDLRDIPRLAIVLGNERDGLSDEMMAACPLRVKVPMRGFVESLNVSVSAAILLAAATEGRPGDLPDVDRLRLYARGLWFSNTRPGDLVERARATKIG